MMELPFELFGFTRFIENEPAMMAFVASFGVLIAAFIIALFIRLPLLKTFFGIIAGGLALALFPGFIVCMIFAFSGIAGMHIFFSWVVIVIACTVFVMFNHQRLVSLMGDITPLKENDVKKATPKKKKKSR
ncbi:hypothetical protein EKN56_20695 [Limnobaculum zhutongyuii]|uniref:Uncharacterized protein n=1 Tax=Limnobaculum zhutongyuii TaxID=2498113 RepID=A0A411WQQ0_9GAMM|nr:hypothetical protein [Limnobaculum zhutongyuii]QBH98594.1 hypothetical protein EKN56_20695 [Limnobaculum zhutongyuii]TQS86876.1 hypothetical protein ELQ32_16840 [Limnobaculum zhutongyuii]